VALLETLGFEVDEKVQIMPTASVAAAPFGLVTARRSFIYSSAAEPREVVNEVLLGETVYLLRASDDGGMFLCHAPDGYVGWINAADVEPMDRAAIQSPRPTTNPPIEAIIESARSKLGRPYIWGGRSDDGLDCSGLVQRAFEAVGLYLPRDAEQQAIVGKLVATRGHRNALRRGDVLFFLGRRGFVAHTAIYLGDGEFIEASGRVKISSFNPAHANYARGRAEGFCFAKRIIDEPAPPNRAPKPAVVSARDWGSMPQPIPDSRKHTPKFITIHHAGVLWEAKTTPDKFVKNMQAWGQKDKNWPDLPYHFLIAPDGRIFEGRPLEYEPESNTKYELAGNIGVEMMGNFNAQRPSPQQLESCVALVAWLAQELEIDPMNIRGHKDAAPGQTDCPGTDFYRYLQDGSFNQWVMQTIRRAEANVQPGPPLPGGPTRSILDFAATQPATAPTTRE
jgi:cell wall-associated NlpC family hydrolase